MSHIPEAVAQRAIQTVMDAERQSYVTLLNAHLALLTECESLKERLARYEQAAEADQAEP